MPQKDDPEWFYRRLELVLLFVAFACFALGECMKAEFIMLVLIYRRLLRE